MSPVQAYSPSDAIETSQSNFLPAAVVYPKVSLSPLKGYHHTLGLYDTYRFGSVRSRFGNMSDENSLCKVIHSLPTGQW